MSGPDREQPAFAPAETHGMSRMARLRGYFLTGLIVAGPLAITAYISWWFINLIDGWMTPLIPVRYRPETYLPYKIPGFGLIVLVFGLTSLGFLTANLVGRTMLDLGERLLDRMPVVRGIYKSAKQIFETIFSQSGTSFRRVALVEYPGPGLWSIVFISSPPSGDIAAKLPGGAEEQIGVFLPCAPNPTTGFFFYVAKSRVREIQTSVDDAFKIVLSLGLLKDEAQQEKMKDLVAASTPLK
jgi:uncharacterized membrane protein